MLDSTVPVKFEVSLAPSSGHFEVSEGGSLVVSGQVSAPNSSGNFELDVSLTDDDDDDLLLNAGDVYKELRLRGYEYGSTFQGIVAVDQLGKC